MIEFHGNTNSFSAKVEGEIVFITLGGRANVKSIALIEPLLQELLHVKQIASKSFHWNLNDVVEFDSAAALMIIGFNMSVVERSATYEIESPQKYIDLIHAIESRQYDRRIVHQDKLNLVQSIGKVALAKLRRFKDFLAFVGELFSSFMIYIFSPKNIRYKEIYHAIEESSIKALGIIALTTFLIGVVLAYQSSVQLKMYGANIFIVDMLGISILRELSPLIAAIVIAGRSGSAFAAQIGVMKITEELDAMRTMGFDPYLFLVLPRIIALMIMMPLIIFFADIMALLGGMLIAKIELGISAQLFIDRFTDSVEMKHFFIGIGKGPFFGFLIASIGIFRGLMVENDTRSIGVNTTKSVVESIFMVIICDAVFSIIFTNMGI